MIKSQRPTQPTTLIGLETPRLSEHVYIEILEAIDRIHVNQTDRDALDAIKRFAFDLLSGGKS